MRCEVGGKILNPHDVLFARFNELWDHVLWSNGPWASQHLQITSFSCGKDMVSNSIYAADRLHLVAQAQSVMTSCNDCVAHVPQQQAKR